MTDRNNFGQWLKQRRKALGLTQAELAQRAGCAQVTLRKIEAGDFAPSAPLAASLAKAVGAADADLPVLVSLARGTGDNFTAKARLLRPQRPNNLAAQLTPLIGRTHDITAVRKRLLSDGARLITLLGPPGVGKTRLAQAVAEDVLEHFEHGVFFVRLAPLTDPTLVASAVAQALGMEMSGANPPELQLRAFLEEKHLLLVLDNFEHLVAAAPLVDDLLRRCPWLHVLITSRQPLRVRGERQMTVRPLTLPIETRDATHPTAEDVLRYSAVALFAERAEAVQHDFAVTDANAVAVAELCRRLDGLPLAIELIAARVKLLSPAELLTRLRGPWLLSADGLRDVSARQKTLRGAIDWSYDLLSPREQILFMRLTVFVGGFTLEAAQTMCEDALLPTQVLDGIASLLDKSLLHGETSLCGEPRYTMLETVREYGLERLARSGEVAALRQRHVKCFMRLVENAEQIVSEPTHILIGDDIHNVWAAFDWATEHDTQTALFLSATLLDWQSVRGLYEEARQLIDKVFALPAASAHTIPRAKAIYKAGILMHFSDEPGKAQTLEEESLVLCQELGYKKGEADASLALGRIASQAWGDQETACQHLDKALAMYRGLSDSPGVAHTLVLLGEIALARADFTLARALCEECLAVARQAGFSFPWPLSILGNVASAEGDLDRARLLHEQRLAIVRQKEGKGSLCHVLVELGTVTTRQGDFATAHACLDEALLLEKERGKEKGTIATHVALAELFFAEGDYGRAIQHYQKSLVDVKKGNGHWTWSSLLLGQAALAEALGLHTLAARLLGATESLDNTIFRLWPDQRDQRIRLAEAAHAQIGAVGFEAAWSQGRQVPLDQAVEAAISVIEASLSFRDSTNPSAVLMTESPLTK